MVLIAVAAWGLFLALAVALCGAARNGDNVAARHMREHHGLDYFAQPRR